MSAQCLNQSAKTARTAAQHGPQRRVNRRTATRVVFAEAPRNATSARDVVARAVSVAAPNTSVVPSKSAPPALAYKTDLIKRLDAVHSYFPTALGIDDFIARVEIALSGYGFTGDNSIACTNLCRDEITAVLKDKIEGSFGGSFNTNGLGGVLTCGVTGFGAGLSHSPQSVDDGKERYIFFSFPHIAIDPVGKLSIVNRPGRCGPSCACGALQKCLNELKVEGIRGNLKNPGFHDPTDPEYSILKQRLARRLAFEQLDAKDMNLADITKLAERTITDDLEFLVEKAVAGKNCDYAVITGVQIHNWEGFDDNHINLEFVAPGAKLYVVVDGSKEYIDLAAMPSLSPRMISVLAAASIGGHSSDMSDVGAVSHPTSTIQEVPTSYLTKRLGWFPGVEATTPASGQGPTYGIPAPKIESESVHTSFVPPVKSS